MAEWHNKMRALAAGQPSPAHAPAAALAESLARDGARIITHQKLDKGGDLVDGGKFFYAGGFEHDLGGDVFLAHFVQLGLLLDLGAHERSVDNTRADAVDSDAMSCCLKSHNLGQPQHGVLRRNIAAHRQGVTQTNGMRAANKQKKETRTRS